MAVLVLRIVNILRPFHQLTVTANLVWSQLRQHLFPLLAFLLVHAQYLRCIDGIQEDFTDYRMHKGSTLVYRTMFRRCRRSSCVRTVRLLPEIVHCKDSTLLDQVVTHFLQELLVASVVVVFPHMGSQPRTRHRVEVPGHVFAFKRSSETEDVARDRSCPSSGTEVSLSRLFTRLYQCTDKVDEWKRTFCQVGRTCRPVVHLHVDVVVVVHTPWSVYIVVPDTLQVRRKITRTRACDEQVTAKLVVQLFQVIVRLTLTIVL